MMDFIIITISYCYHYDHGEIMEESACGGAVFSLGQRVRPQQIH